MVAVVLALFSSFFFALANVTIHRALTGMDYFSGVVLNLTVNALLLWITVVFVPGSRDPWHPANLLFVATGLIVPGFARFFIYKGMERLGTSVSSCLLSAAPLFAIVFAMIFLTERPTLVNVSGALSIVGGITFLSWRGQTKTWQTRDLSFPLTAAFLFAIRDNLVRVGLLVVQSPIFGAAIAATTSAITIGLIYVVTCGPRRLNQATAKGWVLFAASGFGHYIAYVCMYLAFNVGAVAIVSPLVNGSAIFVPPLAYVMLRDIETITLRKVVATVLGVLGVFLISWEKF